MHKVTDDLGLYDFPASLLAQNLKVVITPSENDLVRVEMIENNIQLFNYPKIAKISFRIHCRREVRTFLTVHLIGATFNDHPRTNDDDDDFISFTLATKIYNHLFLPVQSAESIAIAAAKSPSANQTVGTARLFQLTRSQIIRVKEKESQTLGLRIWDCSIYLVHHLMQNRVKSEMQSRDDIGLILEFGSGCGILGAFLGSTHYFKNCPMVLTDLGSDCLELLRSNVSKDVLVFEYNWDDYPTTERTQLFQCINSLRPKGTLILFGADVVYNTSSHGAFLNSVSRLKSLLAPHGVSVECVIAYKRRTYNDELFFEKAQTFGFSVQLDCCYGELVSIYKLL